MDHAVKQELTPHTRDSEPKPAARRKRLGEILIDAGLIDEETLNNALKVQKKEKKKIGEVLVESGVVDEVKIAQALASQLDLRFVRLKDLEIPKEVTELIPANIVEKASVIPIEKNRHGLVVAIANPLDYSTMDDLRFVTRMQVHFVVSPQGDILEAFHKHYRKKGIGDYKSNDLSTLDEVMEIVQPTTVEENQDHDLANLAELPPVIRFTNSVFVDAIDMGASDIHIEPQESELIIRCRVDGVMRTMMKMDKYVHPSLVSRIKIISSLDISERRKPQDGKAQLRYDRKRYDLRVSTIPTTYGEKVTIRILDPDTAKLVPEKLGFSDSDLSNILKAISMPQGIILVTGPTGSGKSSTLYACINKLNTPDVNIITVEDPVEFDVNGINQVQINPLAGISFAAGLRSILRQDPDIVLVGEIRDSETARIAFQAAQTGHLVLSTLHTNDAPSAVCRLLDLGLEDFQLSVALLAVIGQRLVRRICPKCKTQDTPNPQMLSRIHRFLKDGKAPVFWKGAGCDACRKSGYSGRLGLFEVMMATPGVKEKITHNVSALTLQRAAGKDGFKTITQDGIDKALKGATTLAEVFRVAPPAVEGEDREDPSPNAAADSLEPSWTVPVPGPAASQRSAPAAAKGAPATANGEPLPFILENAGLTGKMPKILVVDDNAVVRRLMQKTLEANAFSVVSAENGLEAVEKVVSERPDLIVTDLMMPKMDGLALVKKLKSHTATRRIPVIMLTAREETDAEVAGMDAGANDYLIKPVDPKRFVSRINRLLRQAAA